MERQIVEQSRELFLRLIDGLQLDPVLITVSQVAAFRVEMILRHAEGPSLRANLSTESEKSFNANK